MFYQFIKESKSLLSINGSKFFSYGFNVDNFNDAKLIIEKLKNENKKAVHVCYGLIIKDKNQIIEKSDDDGEPKNSAGKKIVAAIKDNKFLNCLVVIVRYKTKSMLGIGLLTRSYYNATELLVKNDDNKKIFIEKSKLKILINNQKQLNILFKMLKNIDYEIIELNLENNYILINIDKKQEEKFTQNWICTKLN